MKEKTILTGERKKCKHCGNVRRFHHKDTKRLLCLYCGHFIYKDEETELKYKQKEFRNKLKCFMI